jgi:DNA-binding NtrC family response regulator
MAETLVSQFITLLVEDDVLQREVLADLLKDEGFEVVECSTAEAAELIVATSGTELRALITDENLAGTVSGTELAEYARRTFPKMNIILVGNESGPCACFDNFLAQTVSAGEFSGGCSRRMSAAAEAGRGWEVLRH